MSERGKDRTQYFLITMEGGEAVQISSRKEGVGEPVWSPDGTKIAFSAVEPDTKVESGEGDSKQKSDVRVITRIRYKLNGRGFLPDRRAQIYVLDLKTKEVKQLTSGPYDCREPEWSPDGSHIAFVSARYEGHEFSSIRDIYVVPAGGGEIRKVTSSDAVLGGPSYSPDGKWIACYGHDTFKGATVTGVCVGRRRSGVPDQGKLSVASSAGGDMGGPGTRHMVGDSSWIYYSALDWGRTHLYKVNVSTRKWCGSFR